MTDEKAAVSDKKKSTNPLVFIGIGCLVLLILAGIGISYVANMIAKKASIGVLQNVIEGKTGVKTELSNLEEGKMSFTDKKTGTTVDIGSGKIPDSFPKDFPLYPGAKVVSTLSGSEKENSGHWVSFSTPDSSEAVIAFYKTKLAENGWEVTATYDAGGSNTQSIQKGDSNGSLSVTREEGGNETQIMVVLSKESAGN